jgi:hypothetical protein
MDANISAEKEPIKNHRRGTKKEIAARLARDTELFDENIHTAPKPEPIKEGASTITIQSI